MQTVTARRPTPEADGRAGAGPVLQVSDLRVGFRVPGGMVRAVDGVSLGLRAGETLGLVGESGSGKTATATAIMGLLDPRQAVIGGGEVWFEGRDLLRLPEPDMADLRGRALSMIFQEPMTSLNPIMPIGRQIEEPLRRHLRLPRPAARARVRALLAAVGIPDPARAAAGYPHQFSGGMRQRAMIAMAIACRPSVLVADEPTTALDVTIQAQILALLLDLQHELGTAILLITHDLGVVAETAQRVAVMYAGRIVESAPVLALFSAPRHPYTQGLLRSVPAIVRDPPAALPEIEGAPPSLTALPAGCGFAERCKLADAHCRRHAPALETLAPDHAVACWKAGA